MIALHSLLICVGYQAGAWGRFYNHPTRNPHDEGESHCPFRCVKLISGRSHCLLPIAIFDTTYDSEYGTASIEFLLRKILPQKRILQGPGCFDNGRCYENALSPALCLITTQ